MNPFRHLLFILRQRRAGSRVSFSAYLKGYERIVLGQGCKIHANASVDASRSPGVHFGNKVTLNRYAYIQGGMGGVRLGDRVEINNFSIVNGTGGVDIGDDTLIGPGVRIISYQHRHARSMTIREQSVAALPIRIGNDVWIGANAVILAGADLSMVHKICVETHPDVLGDKVLSEMFAGLVAKGFALDFSLIRKNVFFFHRVA